MVPTHHIIYNHMEKLHTGDPDTIEDVVLNLAIHFVQPETNGIHPLLDIK